VPVWSHAAVDAVLELNAGITCEWEIETIQVETFWEVTATRDEHRPIPLAGSSRSVCAGGRVAIRQDRSRRSSDAHIHDPGDPESRAQGSGIRRRCARSSISAKTIARVTIHARRESFGPSIEICAALDRSGNVGCGPKLSATRVNRSRRAMVSRENGRSSVIVDGYLNLARETQDRRIVDVRRITDSRDRSCRDSNATASAN